MKTTNKADVWYTVISIEEIEDIQRRSSYINKLDLSTIIFTKNDITIDIDPKAIEEFKDTGLNNVDFIISKDYLKRYFTKVSLCPNCHCMTHTIDKICGKCDEQKGETKDKMPPKNTYNIKCKITEVKKGKLK